MSLTYAQIQERLEAIEADLGERQEPYAAAAEAAVRTERDMELRVARVKLQTKAETETAKKDKALDAIAAAQDDLFSSHANAQAEYAGLRSAVKVLEIRATIGMSLLKGYTRAESGVVPSGHIHGKRAA